MTYEEFILNELLDRYERSAAYRDANKTNRGVYFDYSRQNLPEYFKDSTSRFKESINGASLNLEKKGYIIIHWMKHEKGNIITKAALNIEKAHEIYSYTGRQPKKEKGQIVIRLAEKYSENTNGWAKEFYEHITASLEKGEGVAVYIDINNPSEAESIFKSVNAASLLTDEVPERIFSIRVLGRSKEFEKIKGRVARIIRDFMKFEDITGEDDILSLCGIVSNPVHVLLSGSLRVLLNSREFDFSCFRPDIGISRETIEAFEITGMDFKRIITVENLTSYYELVKKQGNDSLVVYLGGYPGLSEIKFLKKLKDAIEEKSLNVPFYHWGDIDFGGFSIFKYLSGSVGCHIEPLFMDEETLERYKEYTFPLEPKYGSRLESLLTEPEYEVFHNAIRYMIANKVRLEQECIDVEAVLSYFRTNLHMQLYS